MIGDHREILERLLALAAGPVRERLEKRSNLEFDVPLLILELSELDVCSLLAALAEEFDPATLHDFFCYLLAEDPSRTRPDARFETLFAEEPFPRYAVALLYLMVMDCREHDFRRLAGPIWSDILAAQHLFWPELLTEVLLQVEPQEKLLERALRLAASQVEHERFLGENLLYGLRS